MNLIIVIAIAVVLFGLVFFSRRRFGMLGLALAAGVTVASMWGADAGVVLSSVGVLPSGQSTDAIAIAALTMLPALLLLTKGKKTKKVGLKVFSGVLFVVMSLAVLVEPLTSMLPLDATGVVIYSTLLQYQSLIISAGIVVAVFDILFARSPKPAPDAKAHH